MKFACYSSDTEILTKNKGWLNFKDLTKDDEVATLVDGKYLQYEKPEELHEYDYDGKMYEVKSQQVNLCVTPNHRMYISLEKGKNKKYECKNAENIFGKFANYRKNIVESKIKDIDFYKISETNYDMNALISFIGIWFAEGWTEKKDYRITISANKERVKNKLEEISRVLGIHITKNGEKWIIYNKNLYSLVNGHSVGAINKELPDWAKNLSMNQSRLLLEGMMLGDGYKTKSNCYKYYTSSIKLANDVQVVSLNAGWSANIYKRGSKGDEYCFKDHSGTLNADAYSITIVRMKNNPGVNHPRKQCDKWVDYNGKVHCCTVSSGIIYVRRNGIPVWSGNSRHGQVGCE